MSDPGIRELLDRAVRDVSAPPLAAGAWAEATRRRNRRRRAAVTSAGIAASLAIGVAWFAGPDGVPRRGSVPAGPGPAATSSAPTGPTASTEPTVSSRPTGPPRVQAGPRADDVPDLPGLATEYAALDRVPARPAALSDRPARQARLLLQRPDGPTLLLADDGSWRTITLPAAAARALGENTGAGGRISPDGRLVAFPGVDTVVILDVRTARARVLPGVEAVAPLQYLTWLPDGRAVVAGGDNGQRLWPLEGSPRRTELNAADVVTGGSAPGEVLELGQELSVTRDGTRVATRPLQVAGSTTVDAWYGDAFQRGDRIARTAFVDDNAEQAIVVLNAATGALDALLRLSYEGRSQGCCATLGWLDGDTVLFRDRDEVLAWRPATKTVHRVARVPAEDAVSLAGPAG